MSYCTSADIQQVFGTTVANTWADLDEDSNSTKITARYVRAALVASEQIDDVARAASYRVPIANSAGSTPTTIVDLAATLAGLWLYEARGCLDVNQQTGEAMHRYSYKKLEARRALNEIRDRKLRILDAATA